MQLSLQHEKTVLYTNKVQMNCSILANQGAGF